MKKNILKDADIIIFGGLGDLSLRKIIPAIFYRLEAGQINLNSKVILVSRKKLLISEFNNIIVKSLKNKILKINNIQLKKFLKICFFYSANISDENSLNQLSSLLRNDKNIIRIFYFSTPSNLFSTITDNLKNNNLINSSSRVVLEKPLGNNSDTSKKINNEILNFFNENQIFRIDHYLGKETVQNLMVLRFTNNLFENAWNSQNIDNVQITVAEEIGVESRASYYNNYGALLDMVQNHLLQLVCLVAMEPPNELTADNVRDEKLKVLKSLRPITKESVDNCIEKGQYTRGKINDKKVKSYLEDIKKFSSNTETFVAIRLYIDNWRWASVPFYLRTGKRMSKRKSEIVINFKNIPHNIFPNKKQITNNKLIIKLQPEEKIELVQTVKIPGPGGYRYKPTSLVLDYSSSFKDRFPEAYERLLIDVIRGNQTLFMRKDEVEASWVWIDSISKSWEINNTPNKFYKAGSNGPGESILINNHSWH